MKSTDVRRSGFSLIEIMAAITVLAIILYIIGQAYSSVNGAWRETSSSSDMNSGGRAVLAFMSRELGSAVVNDRYQMKVVHDASSDTYAEYAVKNDRIYFNGMVNFPRSYKNSSGKTQENRSLMEILYYAADATTTDVDKKIGFKYQKVMRAMKYNSSEMSAYGKDAKSVKIDASISPGTNQDSRPLLSFVRSFKVRLYCLDRSSPNAPKIVEMPDGYDSTDSSKGWPKFVPVYADLFLEVLGHDQSQVAAMSGSKAALYTEGNAEKFSTRVYFQNTAGLNQDLP
jgi:prepilin-type N-terminal cleavage/methylation domain-containing protein